MQDRMVQNWDSQVASLGTERISNWQRDKHAVLRPLFSLSFGTNRFFIHSSFPAYLYIAAHTSLYQSDFKINTCKGCFEIKATGTRWCWKANIYSEDLDLLSIFHALVHEHCWVILKSFPRSLLKIFKLQSSKCIYHFNSAKINHSPVNLKRSRLLFWCWLFIKKSNSHLFNQRAFASNCFHPLSLAWKTDCALN